MSDAQRKLFVRVVTRTVEVMEVCSIPAGKNPERAFQYKDTRPEGELVLARAESVVKESWREMSAIERAIWDYHD